MLIPSEVVELVVPVALMVSLVAGFDPASLPSGGNSAVDVDTEGKVSGISPDPDWVVVINRVEASICWICAAIASLALTVKLASCNCCCCCCSCCCCCWEGAPEEAVVLGVGTVDEDEADDEDEDNAGGTCKGHSDVAVGELCDDTTDMSWRIGCITR